LREKVLKCVKKEFPYIVSHKVEEQVNEVLFCSSSKSRIYLAGAKDNQLSPIFDAFSSTNRLVSKLQNDLISISMESMSII